MIALSPKPPRRRNETRDLVHPILVALNKRPGVRVARNNVGVLEWAPGKKLRYGLGQGSADLVGIVRLPMWGPLLSRITDTRDVGRAFALEVKWPDDHTPLARRRKQEAWRRVFRSLGGFACIVHSIDEALMAVDRCREGKSE
jgi:hypothetical protein